MSEFETPGPITATIGFGVAGEVRVIASERSTTVVDVRPSDPNDESDVKAAAQIRVEYSDGTLQVTGPKYTGFADFSRKTRSTDVTIELPAGSQVTGKVQLGDFRADGRLGDTRFKTGTGDLRVEDAGAVHLHTGTGRVTVGHAAGGLDVNTGSGKVTVGRIDGTSVIKNSNGNIDVETITGETRLRTANGDINVDHASADIEAKTAMGALRVGEVVRGSLTLETSMGDVEIGVAEGTAAWIDARTGFGKLRNDLQTTGKPDDTTETVEVRARTTHGHITIRRA